MHKLSARYGVSLYDQELLAIDLLGEPEEKKEYFRKRHAAFWDKITSVTAERLLNHLTRKFNGN